MGEDLVVDMDRDRDELRDAELRTTRTLNWVLAVLLSLMAASWLYELEFPPGGVLIGTVFVMVLARWIGRALEREKD